ncbi:MAG: NlpC/P60 family protein [Lachnospiraceae bacterium]|nr:NlpC/P60 family protein [Lachnospiraceae bacterium]
MEFKNSNVTFDYKNRFGDDMKRFVCDEAARFTTSGNEAASASIDETFERGVLFSKKKSKGKIKEQKRILSEIKEKKKEHLSGESIHPLKEKSDSSSHSSKKSDGKSSGGKEKTAKEIKELDSRAKSAQKAKSKETKKAATKTAVASVFKAKKELSNSLASDKSTGDAMKDGNSGLIRVLTEAINPMRYVKSLGVKILGAIMPYILGFMAVFSIMLIIIAFLFSVLQPLAEVGEALSSFIGHFTSEDVFINEKLSADKIEEIVASSGADKAQEMVIRYALSKVGSPYSQEKRCSGIAYDCSSLAYYSWESVGVDISYGSGYPPTAAEGARMLNTDGKSLETLSLEPGDLVYYGGEANGRYMGIYHVAIYIGDGKAVEALSTTYGVVYQDLRIENAIMVCRPNEGGKIDGR